MGTNIPASALSISNSLIGFNPLYALQSRPSHPRSSIESYNNARTQQPQHNPYYQQPSSHGTVPDSGKHSYAPSQPLLISAANINMNAAALMSQSNMNPSSQQQAQGQGQQQQPYHYQAQQAPYYQ